MNEAEEVAMSATCIEAGRSYERAFPGLVVSPAYAEAVALGALGFSAETPVSGLTRCDIADLGACVLAGALTERSGAR